MEAQGREIMKEGLARHLRGLCDMIHSVAEEYDIELYETREEDDSHLLDLYGAATFLGVHFSAVSRLASAGYIAHQRRVGARGGTGQRYLFDPADLLEIKESGNLTEMMYWSRKYPDMDPRVALGMVPLEDAAEILGINARAIKALADNNEQVHSALRGKGARMLVNLEDVQSTLQAS